MSNKTELQNNNLELSEILGDINALPNASGGSAPTLVTIVVGNSLCDGLQVAYTTYTEDGGMATVSKTLTMGDNPLACVDKTLLVITVPSTDYTLNSNYTGGKITGAFGYSWTWGFVADSSLDADELTESDAYIDVC